MSSIACSASAIVVGRSLGAHADHRHPPVADRQRVGDGDDLHHAGVEQALHTLARRRLGQADGGAEARVRHPAVVLERLDDRPVDRIERVVGAFHCDG